MNIKIACVVVTYNRKKELYKNLNALLNQTRKLDMVIVVDNASSDGTYEYIAEIIENNSVIQYYRLPENTGGSGGFSWGIRKAYELGADYIWGMDDDAIPEKNALEMLLIEGGKINAISALWSNCDNKCVKEIETVNTWMFVGFYIPREIVDKVGFPRDDFFIYWDDHEYALRIQSAGYSIYKIKASVINHQDANKLYYPEKKIGPVHFKMFKMADWKVYYYYRNKILTYKWNDAEKYCTIFWEIPKTVIKSFLYHSGQGKIIVKALIDGITKRTGKRINP